MNEQGPSGPQPPRDDVPRQSPVAGGSQGRLGNPTRLIPRRTAPPTEVEPIDMDPLGFEPEADPAMAAGNERAPYPPAAPQGFGRPQVRVVGLPGCLIAGLIASVVLTILLNILF